MEYTFLRLVIWDVFYYFLKRGSVIRSTQANMDMTVFLKDMKLIANTGH